MFHLVTTCVCRLNHVHLCIQDLVDPQPVNEIFLYFVDEGFLYFVNEGFLYFVDEGFLYFVDEGFLYFVEGTRIVCGGHVF
jgi:hypothetical protein